MRAPAVNFLQDVLSESNHERRAVLAYVNHHRLTIIVHEFVNFLLVAKFHSEQPSSHPQTSPDYVLSSWLCNSIFFVFMGEV